MALDQLLRAITAEGEAAARRIDAEAAAEAARLVAEARERVARVEAEAKAAAERRLAATREAALTVARREAAAALLRVRRRLLDRVLAGAVERLPAALSDPRYLEALPAEMADALSYIPRADGDAAVVRCSPALVAGLAAAPARPGPDVAAARHVASGPAPSSAGMAGLASRAARLEPDSTIGTGFVVRSGDGTVEVDATLETRLARLRAALAIEVFRALEGEHE